MTCNTHLSLEAGKHLVELARRRLGCHPLEAASHDQAIDRLNMMADGQSDRSGRYVLETTVPQQRLQFRLPLAEVDKKLHRSP